MKLTEKEYRKLRDEVEEAKAEYERSRGALDQLKGQLNTKFGVGSFKEAAQLKQKLEKELKQVQQEFERSYKEYISKWKQDGPE